MPARRLQSNSMSHSNSIRGLVWEKSLVEWGLLSQVVTEREMMRNDRKMIGNDRKMIGHERKMIGNERNMIGNERNT